MDAIRVKEQDNVLSINKNDNMNDRISITKTSNSPANFFQKNKPVFNTIKQKTPKVEDMDLMANPEKIHEEEDDDDAVSEASDVSDVSNQEDFETMSEAGGEDDEELEPADGFQSLDDEKQDLLYKLHRASKKGIPVSKKLGAFSDIRELRAEVHKIRKDATVDAGLKMSKKALMAIVGGIEFLNNRYDPFDVDIDGWSESVMLNVNDGDYDNVLERLCEKYSGRGESPPEIELLLTLGGSAMMFHITNSMFKRGLKNNTQAPSPPQPVAPATPMQPTMPSVPSMPSSDNFGSMNNMKGPSMDLSSMMGTISGRFPPMPMMSEPRNKIAELSESSDEDNTQLETASVMSDSASEMSSRSISLTQASRGSKSRRGRKKDIDPSKVISL